MFDLERFVKAQENTYDTALKEIQNGQKETHWMWFIFPQISISNSSRLTIYLLTFFSFIKILLSL